MHPMTRQGDSSQLVTKLQAMLVELGFADPQMAVSGYFCEATDVSARHFQATHVGEDGRTLSVDGIVGPQTWWALENSHGLPQANNFERRLPSGIDGLRKRVLSAAMDEHDKGVCEVPNGSNWGPEIEKYGGWSGAPWCCLFTSWVSRVAMGMYPLDRKHAACAQAWKAAKKFNFHKLKDPIPGDQFIMLHRNSAGELNGKGHTGFVLAVSGTHINTIEGNCGNRVKIGLRPKSTIHGYIDWYDDSDLDKDWQRGLVGVRADVSDEGTR